MTSQPKVPRVLKELARANPGVELIRGTRHWKITKDGRMVGIYPLSRSRPGRVFREHQVAIAPRRGTPGLGDKDHE